MMSVEAKVADDVPPPDAWPPGEEIFGSLEADAEPVVPGAEPTGSGTDPVRLTAWVRGRVQGVGFRWWVRSRALELGLVGSASNLDDGRVEVVAEGPRAACERLLELLTAPQVIVVRVLFSGSSNAGRIRTRPAPRRPASWNADGSAGL